VVGEATPEGMNMQHLHSCLNKYSQERIDKGDLVLNQQCINNDIDCNNDININNDSISYADFSEFKTCINSLPDFINNNVQLSTDLYKLLTHIARSAERISQTLIDSDTHD
jgi:hypothetical protein